jgi:hypothetical protein
LAAALAILFPDRVTSVAHLLGVGRGADLVLYGFVVASVFVWIGLYRRLHEMEHRFVQLNRAIALDGRPPLAPTIPSATGKAGASDEAGR